MGEESGEIAEIIARRMGKARDLKDLAWLLERFLSECYVVEHDGAPRLIFKKAQADRIGSMTIQIYANEHAPPHFHVKSPDIDATFSITDCEKLNGTISAKDEQLIKLWHSGAKGKLIEIWNRMRPTDCPVGIIPLPISRTARNTTSA